MLLSGECERKTVSERRTQSRASSLDLIARQTVDGWSLRKAIAILTAAGRYFALGDWTAG